jgi:hypothetical protein
MSLVDGGGGDGTRKTHIKRIYKNDDPDTGLWVDIERIDELTYTSGTGFAQQEKVWTFDWSSFSPNGEGVTKKKIQDPNDDSDPNDPDAAVIEVPIRGQIVVTQGAKEQYQQYTHFFVNDKTNTSRTTHSRRVYHYDVPDDRLDENKNPPRDPQEYLNALGDKDDTQYLEVEILDEFLTNENENRDAHGQLKPSAWQEKRWLVNNASDTLLHDRDGDTSKDFATKNPADGKIDPPWRLDPLQNIINVGLGDPYKLVMFRQGLRGNTNATISFTTPKTFFTSSEVKQGLPAPGFGGAMTIPSDTHSGNGVFTTEVIDPGSGEFIVTTVTGDALDVVQPFGAPDYRGYTTLFVQEFQEGQGQQFPFGIPGPTGQLIYFNYKGERVGGIPPMTKTEMTKGLRLASDDAGSVYVKSFVTYPGGPAVSQEGITKYDKEGKILWAQNTQPELGAAAPSVQCANYDPKTKLITFILNNGSINVWDMDGNEVSVIPLPPDYSFQSASRKGKLFAFHFGQDGFEDALAAFSSDGVKLWELPFGETIIQTANPFGEDWVITAEFNNFSASNNPIYEPANPNVPPDGPPPGLGWVLVSDSFTNSSDLNMGIYDANGGSKVSSEFWASSSTNGSNTFGPADQIFERNISSYATLVIIHSAYFP